MIALPADVPGNARRPSIVKRRSVALIVFGALIAAFACRDYKHTNPFDPLAPDELTIVGPDSLFSAGEFATYAIQSVPAFTDPTAQWGSSSPNDLTSSEGTGTFELFGAPLYPVAETVMVTVAIGHYNTATGSAWRRTYARTVILTQRLVRIKLRCPDTPACATLAAGGVWSLWIDGFDAGGGQIIRLAYPTTNPTTGTPVATFVSRDTTIAAVTPVGVRVASVTALRSGSTWIVATRVALLDTLRDSLQVVVR